MIEQYSESGSVPAPFLEAFHSSGSTVVENLLLEQYSSSGSVASYLLLSTAESGSNPGPKEWFDKFINPGTGSAPAAFSPKSGQYPFNDGDPTIAAEDCIMPEYEVTCSINTIGDLTDKLRNFSISENRNGAFTGTLEFLDYDGNVAEEISSYSEANDNFKAHDMTDARYWTLKAKQAGRGPTYPHLLPGDPEWDGNCLTRVNVSDFSPIADIDNQTIGDQVYDEGDRKTAHVLLHELAAKAGINLTIGFQDYPVRNFRFAGSNIFSGMDTLMAIRQGYRIWRGQRLHLEAFKEKAPVAHMQDRFHIPQEGGWKHGTSTANLKTFFKAIRNASQPTQLSPPIPCTGPQCVGRVVEITFQRPVSYAIIWATARHGGIEDGVFYDEDGNPVTVGFHHFGPAKVAKWVGTYRPKFSTTGGFTPFWQVQALGGTAPVNGGGPFEVEHAVAVAETNYGRRPEFSNLSSEILLDGNTASQMLGSMATEIIWSVRKGTLNTPFLAPTRVGDFLRVTHYRTGVQENWLVDSQSHSFSWAEGFSNTYGLRGRMAS